MLETLAKPLGSVVVDLLRRFLRPQVKLYCAWCNEPNVNEVGNFLALFVKIVNLGDHTIYFERVEVVSDSRETFYPLFFFVSAGTPIPPRNNVVGLIPCGHVRHQGIREIRIFDATERCYTLKGRRLKKHVEALLQEMDRLESQYLAVHPTHPYPSN